MESGWVPPGLWDLKLIQFGDPIEEKQYKIAHKKLNTQLTSFRLRKTTMHYVIGEVGSSQILQNTEK